jgi:hypothetical protein
VRVTVLTLAFIGMGQANTSVHAALFGVTNSDLVIIEPTNPSATPTIVGPHGLDSLPGFVRVNDLAFNPVSDRIFGIVYVGLSPFDTRLVEYDRGTGTGTVLASVNQITSLQYHNGLGTLIASRQVSSGNSEQIVELSLDGTHSVILDNNNDNDTIVYDSVQDILYAINGENGALNKPDNLYAIDLDTSSTQEIALVQLGSSTAAFDENDNAFLGVEPGNNAEAPNRNNVYRATTTAGGAPVNVDLLGTIPGDTVYGIGFAPVPEPSTLILAVLGLMSLGMTRRRRQRA